MKNEDITFFESQRLNKMLLLIALIPINLISLFGCYSQLIRGIPLGNNPAPDSVLIIMTVIVFLTSANVLWYNMKTIVNSEGICIHIWMCPFYTKTKTFLWEDISHVYIRKYRPLWEYGGWGFRNGLGGIAYNMSGNIGLQIVMQNNKKVLIGTNRSEELFEILQKLGKAE